METIYCTVHFKRLDSRLNIVLFLFKTLYIPPKLCVIPLIEFYQVFEQRFLDEYEYV